MVDLINQFRSEGGEVRYLAYLHDRLSSGKKYIDLLRGLAKIGRTGIQEFHPYASDKIVKIDEISLQVLHPARADCSDALAMSNRDEARNDIPVVLRIEYAGCRVLLGADVQGQGWAWIANRHIDLQADILKFPHNSGAFYYHDKTTNTKRTSKPHHLASNCSGAFVDNSARLLFGSNSNAKYRLAHLSCDSQSYYFGSVEFSVEAMAASAGFFAG